MVNNIYCKETRTEIVCHFRKNFDERLGTFNNIYNRLSIRKNSNEKPISPSCLIYNEMKSPKEKNQFLR